VCVTYGLGLMSIGVGVGKKIKTSKHCIECICTLLRWIYIDCSDGPLCGYRLGGRTQELSQQPNSHPAGLRCPPNARDPDRGAQRRDVIVACLS